MHSQARELIRAGLALDDFGRLRITEAGRELIRHAGVPPRVELPPLWRDAPTTSEHVANLGVPHETPDGMIGGPFPDAGHDAAEPTLAWSRARARRAVGVANGVMGVWAAAPWVQAFLDAYERDVL